MSNFSEIEVEKILKDKIDSLGILTLDEFETKFRSMFGMSDWDQ